MSDVAALIADLVRAGVDPDLIGRTAAALASREPVKIVDEQAERKRAADRERMRIKRDEEKCRAMSRDVADLPSSPEVPPHTPLPNPSNHLPPSPPKGGSSPAGFEDFWSVYPNKVGKREAEKAFAKAIKRADLETILAGLRAYVAKTDDRPWCNPATWLNQDRWEDRPATVIPIPRQATAPPGRRENAADALRAMRAEYRHEPEIRRSDCSDAELLPADKPRLQALVGHLGQTMRWPDGSGHH